MSAYYYPPASNTPQLVLLANAAKYEQSGWRPVSGKYVSAQTTKKQQNTVASKTKTTKKTPTSTTRKTVTKSTNKNGDTVIKVSKTIVVKKK